MAAAAFSSSMRSPTFTGRYEKTVPASVRCTPSTLMSLIVNGSIANAGAARATRQAANSGRARASAPPRDARGCFKSSSAGEQAVDVVVEREEGESQEESEAQALPDLHRPFRDRSSLHDFGEIIHQVPPIQQGNREEVEHAEAHAHQGEEPQRGHPSQPRRLAGIVGDRDGPREVFPG